ncbi:hypothetical protein [uncultured Roseovarius sp.]|uniref:hypothetical protein n=1 Tax=uncultured Roseovarius sp. TaxID=293344 RepID=UPI00260AD985|nr:hypothetical protein [uncultured Roseovarius sp.]
MNQFTIIPSTAALQSAVLARLEDYLDNHGASLESLIRQARADPDVDETSALRDLAEAVMATCDARNLVLRLRTITEELFCLIGEPLAEIAGAYSEPEIDRAICWHAARLTDLERDIKFAFRI